MRRQIKSLDEWADLPLTFWWKLIIGIIGLFWWVWLTLRQFIHWNYNDKDIPDLNYSNKKEKETWRKYNNQTKTTIFSKSDEEKHKDYQYGHARPVYLQLLIVNTATIFFILLSIQEFKINEAVNPIGVDSGKSSPACRVEQNVAYWFLMIPCVILLLYNLSRGQSLFVQEPTDKNWEYVSKRLLEINNLSDEAHILNPKKQASKEDELKSVVKLVKGTRSEPKWAILLPKLPAYMEEYVLWLLCLISIVLYIGFVLINYIDLGIKPMYDCVHPRDESLKRYYDPFEEETTT